MAEKDVSVEFERDKNTDSVAIYAEALFGQANGENIPSGILHWSYIDPYRIGSFDGEEWRSVCDQPTWMQLYTELYAGQKRDVGIISSDALREKLKTYHEREQVPIAIACYDYHTPKRTFVANVIRSARRGEVPQTVAPDAAEEILDRKRSFFASSLQSDRSDAFNFLPHVHDGLLVHFVVPRELCLSNCLTEPYNLEIDFDDGVGFQAVAFDEEVPVQYVDESLKRIRLRLKDGNNAFGAVFNFAIRPLDYPKIDETWPLQGVEPYEGVRAKGKAWVFYGKGHTGIVDPLVFADGFGTGKTSLTDLWNALNSKSLATNLLGSGKDLILLGYDEKSEYIQANAMLAVACIEKAISERQGTVPLSVGGASMGGLVSRYALAWMEHKKRAHETSKYLSFDSPHDGAWLPLIIQYFAYYFENDSDAAKKSAKLLHSPAAQQLLWAWVPTWNYSGCVTDNPLRAKMNKELRAYGWFPRQPKKYGVANGTGTGAGNGDAPGEKAFDWSGNWCVGARPNIEPEPGKEKYMGEMWLKAWWDKYYATNVPALDNAPGGMGSFIGEAAKGAEASGYGSVKRYYDSSCFIPSVSSLSVNKMMDPHVDISKLPAGSSDLDEYICCKSNLNHVAVTPEIAAWILARFT